MTNPFDEFDEKPNKTISPADGWEVVSQTPINTSMPKAASKARRGDGWEDVPASDAGREDVPVSDGWEVVSQVPTSAKNYDLRDVPAAATKNFIPDAVAIPGQIWNGIKTVIGDPVGTAKGLAAHIVSPENIQDAVDIVSNPGAYAARHYEGAKREVAEHPANVALNLATLATGGEGTLGRAALKGTTATFGKAVSAAEKFPSTVLSGLSRDELKAAGRAGELGGAEGRAFTDAMRGRADKGAIVGQAQDAADAWAAKNSADYVADKATWGESHKMLDGGAVYSALDDARKAHSFAGVPDNGSVLNALDKAQEIIDRRLKRPVAGNVPDEVPPAVRQWARAGNAYVEGPAGVVHTPTAPASPAARPLSGGAWTPSAVTMPGVRIPGSATTAHGGGVVNATPAVRIPPTAASVDSVMADYFNQNKPAPHGPRMTGPGPGVTTDIPAATPSIGAVFDRMYAAQNPTPHAPRMTGAKPGAGTVAPGVEGPLPSQHFTPQGFDKLKQELDTLMYDRNIAPQGTKARAAVGKVADAVRSTLYTNAPGYQAAMAKAGEAIATLKEVRGTLSLGEKAKIDTAMSKLQSALRNDVSSRYGYRKTLLDKLSEFDSTLPYAVAGQSFNSWAPKGLAKPLAGHALMTTPLAALASPGFLSALVASVPRAQGEARYAAGATLRGARRAGVTQKNLGLLGEAGRVGGGSGDNTRP